MLAFLIFLAFGVILLAIPAVLLLLAGIPWPAFALALITAWVIEGTLVAALGFVAVSLIRASGERKLCDEATYARVYDNLRLEIEAQRRLVFPKPGQTPRHPTSPHNPEIGDPIKGHKDRTLCGYSVLHRAKVKSVNLGADAFAERVDKSRPRQRH